MVEEIIIKALEGLEREIDHWLGKLRHHFPRHPRFREKVRQVLTFSFNNQTFIIMNLQLSPGTQAPIVPSLINTVTLKPIPGATFVPKSNTVDNAAAASVDANGNLVYVGAGAGNLSSTNTWSYTDENTGLPVVADIVTVSPFTCLAAAEAVTQVVTLGAAVPIPAAQ